MLVDLGLDPYTIDKAIQFGFGMPMGPFRCAGMPGRVLLDWTAWDSASVPVSHRPGFQVVLPGQQSLLSCRP